MVVLQLHQHGAHALHDEVLNVVRGNNDADGWCHARRLQVRAAEVRDAIGAHALFSSIHHALTSYLEVNPGKFLQRI
jgi:hypothetical protein